MSKRIQSFGILCIVISMALCPFLSVSAVSGTAYSSPYMPVCPDYPTSSQLPFGEDLTQVVCLYREDSAHAKHYIWFFLSGTYTNYDGSSSYEVENGLSFVVTPNLNNTAQNTFVFYSHAIILRVDMTVVPNGVTSIDRYQYSNFQQNVNSYVLTHNTLRSYQIISTCGYVWIGYPVDVAIAQGIYNANDLVTPNYIASYPDTVKQAIDSISDNSALLSQYYTSLNSKLNSLSIDVQYIQGQNDELSSKVDELQSQLGSQSSAYQSALATAQSQIESNAQSAAQSAADDINNAGEDVSDLDDDMDDVNSIVETLDGWIEDLDSFADTIDDSADAVADALDNASDFVSGFIGACPAIVVALFSFALVFLVVRKIIGR